MKQSLISELKQIAVDNISNDDQTIETNVSASLDQMIVENKIFDYSLNIEVGRIIISIQEKSNSISYAFQVQRN